MSSDPGQITIVALGDSIVAGWPGPPSAAWPRLLEEHLHEGMPDMKWRVLGAGVPGDTAPQGYLRFERDVAAAGPELVLIAFGLNDCNLARHGMDRLFEALIPRDLALRSYSWRAAEVRLRSLGEQIGLLPPVEPELGRVDRPRTSDEGFVAAVMALVDRVRVIGAQPVLVTMTPVLVDAPERVETLAHGSGFAVYKRYNRLIEECAGKMGLPLIVLSSVLPPGSHESDGVHLAPEGQAQVAAEVYGQLQEIGLWAALAEGASDE